MIELQQHKNYSLNRYMVKIKAKNLRRYIVCFLLFIFSSSAIYAQYGSNLLTNPGAENSYTGWTVTNGGSGWDLTFRAARTGLNCWNSSYLNCTLVQTIDLLAAGYSATVLDGIPSITAGVWVAAANGGPITIKIELLNSSDGVISTTYISTEYIPDATDYALKSTTITGYSTGVRKIKMTLIGRDASKGWAGQYGPRFDDAYVQIDGILPVELTTFLAQAKGNSVQLNWQTATEVKNYGFEIERKAGSGQFSAGDYEKIGFVNGNGNSNSPKNYSYEDKNLSAGKYSYRLKQMDNDGKYTYNKEVEVDLGLPKEFFLEQNYPNPFNPSTVIRYTLPFDSKVVIKIYNALGKEAALLKDEIISAGSYEVQFNASSLSSGVYFYRLSAESVDGKQKCTSIKKMMLLK